MNPQTDPPNPQLKDAVKQTVSDQQQRQVDALKQTGQNLLNTIDQKLTELDHDTQDLQLDAIRAHGNFYRAYTSLLRKTGLTDRQVNTAIGVDSRTQTLKTVLRDAIFVGGAALATSLLSTDALANLPSVDADPIPPTESTWADSEKDADRVDADHQTLLPTIANGDIIFEAPQIIFDADTIVGPISEQPDQSVQQQPIPQRAPQQSDRATVQLASLHDSVPQLTEQPRDAIRSEPERRSTPPATPTPTEQPARVQPLTGPLTQQQGVAFLRSRNTVGARLDSVDPRLMHIAAEGIRVFEAKHGDRYSVEMLGPSGGHRDHGSSYHTRGQALDLVIKDKVTGGRLTNFPGYESRGFQGRVGEVAPLYQELMNGARVAAEKFYPDVAPQVRWGGYGDWGSNAFDTMHLDFGGERGMGGGTFEQGFTPRFMERYNIPSNKPIRDMRKAVEQQYSQPPADPKAAEPTVKKQTDQQEEDPPKVVGPTKKRSPARAPAVVAPARDRDMRSSIIEPVD